MFLIWRAAWTAIVPPGALFASLGSAARRRAFAHRLPPPSPACNRPKSRHASLSRFAHHTKACITGFSSKGNVSSSVPASAQRAAGSPESSARRAAACQWRASPIPKRQSPASCWVRLSFLGVPFKGSGQEVAAESEMGMQTVDYNQEDSFDVRRQSWTDQWQSGTQVERNKCRGDLGHHARRRPEMSRP